MIEIIFLAMFWVATDPLSSKWVELDRQTPKTICYDSYHGESQRVFTCESISKRDR